LSLSDVPSIYFGLNMTIFREVSKQRKTVMADFVKCSAYIEPKKKLSNVIAENV
jgi:hypothetical protein